VTIPFLLLLFFLLLILRLPPSSTLFPYTTLFRSYPCSNRPSSTFRGSESTQSKAFGIMAFNAGMMPIASKSALGSLALSFTRNRSEEHTSELQSRENLVCRLLLEKKKKKKKKKK